MDPDLDGNNESTNTLDISNLSLNEWTPEILILGPGGIKGFLELGALCLLEEEGYLKNIKTYVGVSIGAIIGLLLVAGYKPIEIIENALDTNLFQDLSSINFENIKHNTGLISNKSIKDKLIELMEEKFGFVPNLQQLYLATGLEFMCVSMNLSKDQAEYISYKTEPDINCVDAVLLSSNIPLLFYKLKYKGCIYIDGAFGNPYPIDQYDNNKVQILGIYITGQNKERTASQTIPDDFPIAIYLYKIIDSSIIQIRDRIIKNSSSCCKHLRLFCSTIDTIGLTIDMKAKSQMVLQGYHVAKQFIYQIHNPKQEEIIIDPVSPETEELYTQNDILSALQNYDNPFNSENQSDNNESEK